MKYTVVILFFIFYILSEACTTSRKITYVFPDAMAEQIRSEYLKQCEKGRILYDINCAKCHTTTVNRKAIVPDFEPEKLIGYELRVKNAEHENNLPETAISSEEFGLIMTFLSYKKKN